MNQTSHSHSHPQQEHNSSANAVGTTGSDKSARTLIKRWFLLSALLHGSTWSPCQQLHACSASVGIVICHQNHRNSKSLETASINSVSLKAQAPPNSGLSSHPTFPQSARATPLDLEATLQRHGAHLLGGSRVSRWYGQDEAQFVSCCCCFVWAMAIPKLWDSSKTVVCTKVPLNSLIWGALLWNISSWLDTKLAHQALDAFRHDDEGRSGETSLEQRAKPYATPLKLNGWRPHTAIFDRNHFPTVVSGASSHPAINFQGGYRMRSPP